MISASHRRPLALPALLSLLILTGCTASKPAAGPAMSTEQATSTEEAMGHVHALAVQDDRIIIATHAGPYELPADGGDVTGPIGGASFDAMGFTIDNGILYGSGHPDAGSPAQFGSPNLGLISSTDQGQSWTTVSLGGETDFHDLTASGGVIYGVDSASGTIKRSDDNGANWIDGATLDVRDLEIDPDDPMRVSATTADGLAVSTDGGLSFAVDDTAPKAFFLTTGPDRTRYTVDVARTLWASTPTGWVAGGTVTGTPAALAVDGERLIVADDAGIRATTDLGATWEVLWQPVAAE